MMNKNIYIKTISLCIVIIAGCNDTTGPSIHGCTATNACNYNPEATINDGFCTFPEEGYNCEGDCIIDVDCAGICGGVEIIDECGECGGDGIDDGECDCAGNVLDCYNECGGSAAIDECDICNGPGAIYECGCSDPGQNHDCDGNCISLYDCSGACGGNTLPVNCTIGDEINSIWLYNTSYGIWKILINTNYQVAGLQMDVTIDDTFEQANSLLDDFIFTHDNDGDANITIILFSTVAEIIPNGEIIQINQIGLPVITSLTCSDVVGEEVEDIKIDIGE